MHIVNEETGDILNGAVFSEVMPPTNEADMAEWLETISLEDVDIYYWRTEEGRIFLTPFDPETQSAAGDETGFEYTMLGAGTAFNSEGISYAKIMDVDDGFDFEWLFGLFGG